MRHKLSKELRRIAGQLTDDATITTSPQRQWHKNSLRANYRKLKRLFLYTNRPTRRALLDRLKTQM